MSSPEAPHNDARRVGLAEAAKVLQLVSYWNHLVGAQSRETKQTLVSWGHEARRGLTYSNHIGDRCGPGQKRKTIAELQGYVRFALSRLIPVQVYVDTIDRGGTASCLSAQLD